MMKRVWWGDFTAREFENLNPHETIAVLPIAATEQHGPHLPVSTDHAIMKGMLETVFPLLPDEIDVRFLPIQCIGKSNEHMWCAGTLTLTAETALAAWTELGRSIAQTGIKKLVIVNSHGGNRDLLPIIARDLRVRNAMLVTTCQWGAFGYPEGVFSDRELEFGLHGGDVETSLMLAFRPDLVATELAQDFVSSAETATIPPVGPVAAAWIARDLNPHGVVGEAHKAKADKGRATAAHQARGFVHLLKTVRDAPFPFA